MGNWTRRTSRKTSLINSWPSSTPIQSSCVILVITLRIRRAAEWNSIKVWNKDWRAKVMRANIIALLILARSRMVEISSHTRFPRRMIKLRTGTSKMLVLIQPRKAAITFRLMLESRRSKGAEPIRKAIMSAFSITRRWQWCPASIQALTHQ